MLSRYFNPCLTLLSLVWLLAAHPVSADSIRIMPVGDSDTSGYGGYVSYRYDLWFMLQEAGFDVDFVGRSSLTTGGVDADLYPNYDQFDKDHEGRYGGLIDEFAPLATNMTLANEPDVVLFLNSHDICEYGSGAPVTARIYLDQFIDNVRSVDPKVHFLLGQIYPYDIVTCHPDSGSIIPNLNAEIAAVAARKDSSQSRVLVVDHNTGFDVDTMFSPKNFHANRKGEMFIAQNWFNGLEIVIPLVEPSNEGLALNAGLNDAWYDPKTAGQGFFIVVYEDLSQVFLAWFTYDTERPPSNVIAKLGEPGHRWLTAQGPFENGRALLDVIVSEGGLFDSAASLPQNRTDGTIELVFESCSAGVIKYKIDSLGLTGEIPIQRVAEDNIPLCEILSESDP